MNRTTNLFAASIVLALAAVACDKSAQQDQDKVNAAQQTATDKITSAQLEANDKISAAQADFLKTREGYRHDVQNNLIDVDARIQKLSDKEKTLISQKKIDMDTSLSDIQAKRASFVSDVKALDQSTAATWDATKTNTDQAWYDLKAAVDKVTPVL